MFQLFEARNKLVTTVVGHFFTIGVVSHKCNCSIKIKETTFLAFYILIKFIPLIIFLHLIGFIPHNFLKVPPKRNS